MTLMIQVNRLRRIIFKLVKGEPLDESQQRAVDKIMQELDKKDTPQKMNDSSEENSSNN